MAAEASASAFDCIVIGTGMGGSVLGWALARAGWRVLFLEQGKNSLTDPERLAGNYAETFFDRSDIPTPANAATLARAGRYGEAITVESGKGSYEHVPFIGSGTGGSTALFGMALERFFASDFTPRRKHPAAVDLPDRWPFTYDELAPYYARAEALFGVRGTADPLKPDSGRVEAGAQLSPLSRQFFEHFEGRGLHPYQIPLACREVAGCGLCQGYLCDRECKQDAARVAIRPAVADHGAVLWDGCTVQRLEASQRRIEAVVCERAGQTTRIAAPVVVLAAGALNSPRLLLASSDSHWRSGLANRSDLVGRNLMRHYTDLYAVTPGPPGENHHKQIAFNDWYEGPNGAWGTVQSFGRLPPASMLAESVKGDIAKSRYGVLVPAYQVVKPLLRRTLRAMVDRSFVMATICEDLPDRDNCVRLHEGRLRLRYQVNATERTRIAGLRQRMKQALSPYRYRLIAQAENSGLLAHVCGTCRAGDAPEGSVVDRHNRCHDLENLYIVDGSFFPTSGGTNPALTIAANAWRVADHLLQRTA